MPTRSAAASARGSPSPRWVVTEALAAADRLQQADVPADVVCVTRPDLLHRAQRSRLGLEDGPSWVLDQAFPAHRATLDLAD